MKIYGWRWEIIDDLHNAIGSLPPLEREWRGRDSKSFEVLQQACKSMIMHTYVPELNNFWQMIITVTFMKHIKCKQHIYNED